ncbi:hypothetical protein [Lacipirellula limnantheis]|uniref:Uncharacterized protein n=1 Tax=Lacipirellula limnantheis TaxID=2528024 RepID=A0A517TZ96_9BACT|nr:hypothetical protein [Lacipirellula limnantheis]QDT73692.1 hypothetical protein I41_28820 [Lacipirellula limnantheis]
MSEKRPSYWDMPAELRPPNWRRLQAEIYAEEERVALPAFRDDALAAYTAHLQALRRPQPTELQRLVADWPSLVAAREWPDDCELASMLEAFVLARHSNGRISQRLCLPLESVIYYIAVNFDVRPLRNYPAYVRRFGIEIERERGNPETAAEREAVKYLAYCSGPYVLDGLFDTATRKDEKPWIGVRDAVRQLLGKQRMRRLAQLLDKSLPGDQLLQIDEEEAWIDAVAKFIPAADAANIANYYLYRQHWNDRHGLPVPYDHNGFDELTESDLDATSAVPSPGPSPGVSPSAGPSGERP